MRTGATTSETPWRFALPSSVALLTVAVGVAYVVGLAYAMHAFTYDTWGVFTLTPPLILLSVLATRYVFRSEPHGTLRLALLGLAAKVGGSFLIYFVTFQAYGHGDSGLYHSVGKTIASEFWMNERTLRSIIPTSTGTPFMSEVTGVVYTMIGTSELAGYIFFGVLSYWGLVFYVKAAFVAVPGLCNTHYPKYMFLVPSLLFWSSTVGKESFLMFCLGATTLGVANLLAGHRLTTSLALTAVPLIPVGFLRPHYVGIWTGGFVAALAAAAFLPSARVSGRRVRFWLLTAIGAITLAGVISLVLSFLDTRKTNDDESVTEQVQLIFDRVENQTATGGSVITPVTVNGPQDWPWAALRTLSRPMLFEARSAPELAVALETTVLLGIAALRWRALLALPRLLFRHPYLLGAAVMTVAFGVAFSSFNNLGLLARQRSLILPMLLLFISLPRPLGGTNNPPSIKPDSRASHLPLT